MRAAVSRSSMQRRRFLQIGLGGLLAPGVFADAAWAGRPAIQRICLGACARQERPQPIWDVIADRNPDLFVFLGDNIYGDTRDMRVLRDAYAALAGKPEFQRFRDRVPIVATWDDHDYGENNAHGGYPMKRESKRIFLDFFDEPRDSERRQREGGIHTTYEFGGPDRRVQLILLDTRYHRSAFRRAAWPRVVARKLGGHGPFVADDGAEHTMLGQAQWAWLAAQLRRPADLRIIATSTPFVSSFTGSETWANLPRERARLIRTIEATRADRVILISGDIHRAELSAAQGAPYPLWELSSSGLNRDTQYEGPNANRVGAAYHGHNFGLIEIEWDAPTPHIRLQACDRRGNVVIDKVLPLGELRTGI